MTSIRLIACSSCARVYEWDYLPEGNVIDNRDEKVCPSCFEQLERNDSIYIEGE